MIDELITRNDLAQAGGLVLVLIMLLSTLMWAMILERFWFFKSNLKALLETTVNDWRRLATSDSGINQRLRNGLTSGFHARLTRGLGVIQVIAAILPMLGLLGTVMGMIKTFEVMTIFGAGNTRGMAEGISQALITTMAGLITAIFGIFFANQLEQKVAYQTEYLHQCLSREESH